MFSGNKNKVLKEQLKDLPYDLGAASLAILFGVGNGFIKSLEGMLMINKMGPGGAFDWGMNNSRDFISDYLEIKKILKNLKENNSRVILHRLRQKNLIEKKNNQFKLTSLGVKYFNKLLKINDKKESKRWDGKWRIVMFDIPEKIKNERYWLRFKLFELGYKTLQKSVFIGKYPLTEELYKRILVKKLKNYIRIITVGEIDDENIFLKFN